MPFQKGNKLFFGKKHSLKSIEKNRQAHLGKKLSLKTRLKISQATKGKSKPFTQEHRRKISETHWDSSGDKNPMWKGGVSKNPYPKEFNSSLKLKIRHRDNFTCQLCGRTEREELEELNRVLCVNHIDFNKKNCKENNLNTLCVRCNTKINKDREFWTDHFNQFYGSTSGYS